MAPREGYTEKKDYDTSKTNTASASFEMASLAMAEANKDMLYSEISKASYADKEGDMPGVQPFHAVFDREVIRVADFINSQQHNLEFSAKSLLTSAEVASETKNPEGGIDLVHSLALKMDDLVENIIELQTCMAQNRSILRVVAEKADKELKTSCTSLLERRLKTNLNSVLVCVASDIYAAIRTAEKNITNNGAGQDGGMWEAPSSFQRATTKYWVRDDNLTKLLLSCAAEAPLLVYGKKGSLTPKENRHSGQSEGDKLWESLAMPITSVYFDSADMGLYKKRIARIEGAQLLRARWYGNKMPTGDGIIFLELKTHHEKWVSNKSVKERAAVKESDMQEFLRPIRWTIHDAQAMIARASPTLGSDELAKSANLLFRMHRLVVKHKLQSCVRSIYMRAAFQSPKSNGKICSTCFLSCLFLHRSSFSLLFFSSGTFQLCRSPSHS
jgi:SPX domain protein involved in polyphosphate accumulation